MAKKAKLDPEAYKSALDVHKEKELKRKREIEEEAGDLVDLDTLEKPREGLKAKTGVKKQKTSEVPSDAITEDEAARRKAVADKRKEKREKKKAKETKKRDKMEAKKGKRNGVEDKSEASVQETTNGGSDSESDEDEDEEMPQVKVSTVEDHSDEELQGNDLEKMDLAGIVDEEEENEEEAEAEADSSVSPTAADQVLNSSRPSTASSTSSIAPVTAEEVPKVKSTEAHTKASESSTAESVVQPRESPPKLPQIDSVVLQQRLAARIEALRTARKADGPNGKPARNRQELLEARRLKEEQRRAHKKELRAQGKATRSAEEEAARLRGGSGSPLWSPAVLSPRVEKVEHNFSFGRVAFADGAEMNSTLTDVVAARKKKGSQDAKQALEAVQRKAERIAGLDDEARADIADKDAWLNAKRRVHGEKIRDDASLLKKTLKRRDKGKAKSEKEWTERIEGVKHGQEMRQKKREQNLQKRKDEKGTKGGSKKKPAPKKRPGFEGSFKAGGGGGGGGGGSRK